MALSEPDYEPNPNSEVFQILVHNLDLLPPAPHLTPPCLETQASDPVEGTAEPTTAETAVCAELIDLMPLSGVVRWIVFSTDKTLRHCVRSCDSLLHRFATRNSLLDRSFLLATRTSLLDRSFLLSNVHGCPFVHTTIPVQNVKHVPTSPLKIVPAFRFRSSPNALFSTH